MRYLMMVLVAAVLLMGCSKGLDAVQDFQDAREVYVMESICATNMSVSHDRADIQFDGLGGCYVNEL